MNKRIQVIATEQDGLQTRSIVIELEILSPLPNFDILKAVKDASLEYCKTDEGKDTFTHNCDCFNWADFNMFVPNTICQKYGFLKIGDCLDTFNVNFDEQLVNAEDVYNTNLTA